MATGSWQCNSCGLYNSYVTNNCQACFTSMPSPNNSGRKFKLTTDFPSSKLLDIIIKTSQIAKQSGYLISFESEKRVLESNDIKFMVMLAKNLAKKPKLKLDETKTNAVKSFKDPFIPPFDVGQHVLDLHDEYRILLNKFNVVPNHILIITSSFVLQTSPLIPKDFDITFKVILSMNGLCYFNSGPFSGASQPHKHIQIIPRNYKFPMEQFIKNINTNHHNDKEEKQSDNINDNMFYVLTEYSSFIHRIYLIDDNKDNNLYNAYCSMINEIKNDMEKCGNKEYLSQDKFSYNMILTTDYMFIAGRKNDVYFNDKEFGNEINISVNAVTFAGTFFCKSEQSVSMLKHVGPLAVLDFVTFQQK